VKKIKTITIVGEVWKYDGPAAWYFIYAREKDSENIKKTYPNSKKVGFGYVPIKCTLL